MVAKAVRKALMISMVAGLLIPAAVCWGQQQPWGSTYPQPQTPTSNYPTNQGGVPQQNPYGGQQPNQGGTPQQNVQATQAFTDAFQQFQIGLSQGTTPVTSSYNFAVPHANTQITISATTQAQMFQQHQQMFPQMLQQMGGQIQSQKTVTYNGMQCQYIVAVVNNAQTNQSFVSHNLFVPQARLFIQAMSPQQNSQQAAQILDAMMRTLQVAK